MKVGEYVRIIGTNKNNYSKYKNVVGKHGIVKNVTSSEIGVAIDGEYNNMSSNGLYWFHEEYLEVIKNESEETVMENYKYVAIVNLLEDSYKKDYAFALYEEDFASACYIQEQNSPVMVVVNARSKDNRKLATIKNIIAVEDYSGAKITAEVVGVVNMNYYIAREKEKERQKELEKKKAAIEKELEAEINKRKSVQYYEEMARKYSDNPKIAALVAELKGLCV